MDHAILRDILFRTIADTQTRWLIEHILASGAGVLRDEYTVVYFPDDDLLSALRPRGLPMVPGILTQSEGFWGSPARQAVWLASKPPRFLKAKPAYL